MHHFKLRARRSVRYASRCISSRELPSLEQCIQRVSLGNIALLASGPTTAGKSIQNTSQATYENVTTEESKQENMHKDTMPAETQEPTKHLHHPNPPSTEPTSTAQKTPPTPPKSANTTTHQNQPPPPTQPPTTFTGYLATSPTSPLTHTPFPPKTFRPTDIDIAITHCGLCFSDISTLRSSWSPTPYPICLGHEIIGTAIRIGASARPGIHVGDRVGVGPQGYNCHSSSCGPCSSGKENYCPRRVGTYGERYEDGSGMSQGGFAEFTRQDSGSVVRIPEGIDGASAAVMLCAGATVYEPLKEHGAAMPGKRVGIVGLGGLGHLGVLFAKAMGCEHVVGVSRREEKREHAVELGADGYIATADEEGWAEKHAASLDLIICTVSDPRMPLMEYLGLLRPKGVFCQVGIPEGPLPQLDTMALVLNGTSVCFSDSASPGNVREMLDLAAEKGVKAWTECRPMEEINSVIKEMEEGRGRFRYVMVNEGSEKAIQKTE